jgi:hypothetical protein
MPMQSRNTNSIPSDIPVQKAKEWKSNSEEQCTWRGQMASGQMASEYKWTNQ